MFKEIHQRWQPPQIALWLAVQNQLLSEPHRFDPFHFMRIFSPDNDPQHDVLLSACIGGWGHILSGCPDPHGKKSFSAEAIACATASFGLNFHERLVVFSAPPVEWPAVFAVDFNSSNSVVTRAKIAAAYIERIVATGGVVQ